MNIDDYYEQLGSGPAIVFIHGSYASTSTWKKMVEQLAVNHQCILIKLPGHCGTPDPEDFTHPTIDTELEIVRQVIIKLTDAPVHLVGHSFGGVVALSLALKGSVPLSQMTLFEPVAVWVLDRMKDNKQAVAVQTFLTEYFHAVETNKPEAYGQVIDFWGGNGAFAPLPKFIKESMSLLVKNNVRHWNLCTAIDNTLDDLHHLKVPTRLVCGAQSNAVAHAIVDHLKHELPTSKKYTLKGASHFLVTSHVDECLFALTDRSILSEQ